MARTRSADHQRSHDPVPTTLPIKLCGLGILSIAHVPLSLSKPSQSFSDIVLGQKLPYSHTHPTQRDPRRIRFVQQREALGDTLTALGPAQLLESTYMLGGKWLDAITVQHLARSVHLSAALQVGMKIPKRPSHYHMCCEPLPDLGDDVMCHAQRNPMTLWRHEAVKNAMGNALGTLLYKASPPVSSPLQMEAVAGSLSASSAAQVPAGPIRSEEVDK